MDEMLLMAVSLQLFRSERSEWEERVGGVNWDGNLHFCLDSCDGLAWNLNLNNIYCWEGLKMET